MLIIVAAKHVPTYQHINRNAHLVPNSTDSSSHASEEENWSTSQVQILTRKIRIDEQTDIFASNRDRRLWHLQQVLYYLNTFPFIRRKFQTKVYFCKIFMIFRTSFNIILKSRIFTLTWNLHLDSNWLVHIDKPICMLHFFKSVRIFVPAPGLRQCKSCTYLDCFLTSFDKVPAFCNSSGTPMFLKFLCIACITISVIAPALHCF